MFSTALIIALRRMARERFYVFICVASLSLGVACSLVISLYLYSELTYDHHHKNHERIYRINTTAFSITMASAGFETGPLLVQDNPEILNFVRFQRAPETAFSHGDNTIDWEKVYLADASVFDVFTINAVYGDKQSALSDPYSIAISRSFSEKYFGHENPVGWILSSGEYDFHVTLVYEDLPENVQFRYNALLPMQLAAVYDPDYLADAMVRYVGNYSTYLLVSEFFDSEDFESMSRHYYEFYLQSSIPADAGPFSQTAKPLASVYYGNEVLDYEGERGNKVNLYSFMALAVFLLLIACINYINITTARATKRGKEVGMRKVVGAQRYQLVSQFLAESFALCSLSFVIGILMAVCILEVGAISTLIGKTELLPILFSAEFLIFILLIWISVSLISGLYPALYLSGAAVMTSMKQGGSPRTRAINSRQLLVLFQLIISSSIIICVLIMESQIRFVINTPLGFETVNRIVVRLVGADVLEGVPAMTAELVQHNDIISVTAAQRAPGTSLNITVQSIESNDGIEVSTMTNPFSVGHDFLETMGIELLQGRTLTEDATSGVLVNETLVHRLEWEQPLGKKIGDSEVIGVFKDFHYISLYEPIGSMILRPLSTDFSGLNARQRRIASRDLMIAISGNNIDETRRYIREVVEQFTQNGNFELRLLDETWSGFYDDAIRTTRLVSFFAGISIAISLLGLTGLSAYATEQRRKEIAIRKVLGASTSQLLAMLSKSIWVMVVVAVIPSSIVSYFTINIWLQRFAYQVDLSLFPFLTAFIAVAVISLVTVLLQSYGTAQSNPVGNLRHE